MTTMASQITSFTIVYSTVYSGADKRKHQSSASLAFVRGIHRGPLIYPHKWPVTRKMFPFDDVTIRYWIGLRLQRINYQAVNEKLSWHRFQSALLRNKNLHSASICPTIIPWFIIRNRSRHTYVSAKKYLNFLWYQYEVRKRFFHNWNLLTLELSFG